MCSPRAASTPTPSVRFRTASAAVSPRSATTGIKLDLSLLQTVQTVELFGHVTLVEGYAIPTYIGCHALVALRDTPGKTIAVLTTETRLQSLLETALATGNLIAFWGQLLANPPTPSGAG